MKNFKLKGNLSALGIVQNPLMREIIGRQFGNV
jgi:hypothetical protein